MLKKLFTLFILLALIAILAQFAIPKLAVFYHNKGVEAFNNQQYEMGVKLFEKSLYIMPSIDTYDYLAHTYDKLNEIDHAVKIYKKIISSNPSYASAYIELGKIYLEKHMLKEAVALQESALEIIPSNQDVHEFFDKAYLYFSNALVNQSLTSYMIGRKPEAYHLLNKALKLKPDYTYAHYILGYYYYSDNDLEPALLKLNHVVNIEPEYWQAYKLIGDIYFKKNEYHMAVDAYKKILDSNHHDYTVYNDIGISFMNMENYGQAIVYLEEAVRLNPYNTDVIFNLASTYKDMGLFDKAALEYDKLSRYDKGYPNMHNNLADICIINGREDLALDAYRREIEYTQQRLAYNPNNVNELNNLARAYGGVGDYQKAKNLISRVIAMVPDYKIAYITLAKIEEKQHNYDAALQALYKARSMAAYRDFIDQHIANIKNKIYTSVIPAMPVKTKKTFIPSHKIFFKSGRSMEGIMHSRTEDEIVLYVQAENSNLKIALSASDIDRIVEYDRKPR